MKRDRRKFSWTTSFKPSASPAAWDAGGTIEFPIRKADEDGGGTFHCTSDTVFDLFPWPQFDELGAERCAVPAGASPV